MTGINDIDDDSATKHGDIRPATLIARVSDLRDFTPQGLIRVGTSLTKMIVPVCTASVAIKIRPALLFLHFAEDRFISGDQVKPARSETLAQSMTAHAFGETVCYHAARIYPSHHVGLV